MNRHSTGRYYVQRLGGGKSIEKLLEDKNKLQRQLKVTRQNNAIYKKTVSDLTSKNRDLDGRLQEIKAEVATGAEELIVMRKKINELVSNNTDISSELTSSRKEKTEVMENLEKIDKELKAEKDLRLQLQDTKLELEKLILELNTNSSKITTELEICKNETVKLLDMQNKLQVCDDELEVVKKKRINLELDNSEISQSLEESKEEASNHQLLYDKCKKDLERARTTAATATATTTSTTTTTSIANTTSTTSTKSTEDCIREDDPKGEEYNGKTNTASGFSCMQWIKVWSPNWDSKLTKPVDGLNHNFCRNIIGKHARAKCLPRN